MSVTSMAQLAANDASVPANNADLIARYIPSEAIAVYIGALGILIPATQATADEVHAVRFICYLAGLAIALVLAVVGLDTTTIGSPSEARRRQLVVAVMAAVAFTLWAAAIPQFFVDGTILTIAFTQWAAVVVIVAAVLLPLIAKALGVRLQTSASEREAAAAVATAPIVDAQATAGPAAGDGEGSDGTDAAVAAETEAGATATAGQE